MWDNTQSIETALVISVAKGIAKSMGWLQEPRHVVRMDFQYWETLASESLTTILQHFRQVAIDNGLNGTNVVKIFDEAMQQRQEHSAHHGMQLSLQEEHHQPSTSHTHGTPLSFQEQHHQSSASQPRGTQLSLQEQLADLRLMHFEGDLFDDTEYMLSRFIHGKGDGPSSSADDAESMERLRKEIQGTHGAFPLNFLMIKIKRFRK
jgi:hypothetical protein